MAEQRSRTLSRAGSALKDTIKSGEPLRLRHLRKILNGGLKDAFTRREREREEIIAPEPIFTYTK
ncbi:MAG: hypothetical protein LQ346_006029 [Caloplaca aetnensis]|nr:MAG: hypothetical protein LQ346_006029 [Caloplaca aetnensis]